MCSSARSPSLLPLPMHSHTLLVQPPPSTSYQPPGSSSKAEGCFLFFHEERNPPFERHILLLMLPDINIIIPKQPQSPAVAGD